MSFRTAGSPPVAPSFGSPPRDVVALVAVVSATFALQFFASTAPLVALLRLSPAVWQAGFVWQVATYPFAGAGGPSAWFLLALFVLFWFARDVRLALGLRRFWTLLGVGSVVAALVAIGARLGVGEVAGPLGAPPFAGMQGQWMLTTLVIAAFATRFGERTILLFFVLPIRAAWFLPLELALAFIAFLGDRDLATFAGICAGVATAWALARSGPRITLRERRLRLEKWWLERKMARLRRKSGFRVVRGDRHLN